MKSALFYLCLLGIAGLASAQPAALDTIWTRTIPVPDLNSLSCIISMDDGGCAIVGSIQPEEQDEPQFWIARLSSLGDMLWFTTIEMFFDQRYNCVTETPEGGLLLAGSRTAGTVGGSDIVLLSVDAIGDALWSRSYGVENGGTCGGIVRTGDYGYAVACNDSGRVILMRINLQGDSLWSSIHTATVPRSCAWLASRYEGGFYLAINDQVRDYWGSNGTVIQLDSAGAETELCTILGDYPFINGRWKFVGEYPGSGVFTLGGGFIGWSPITVQIDNYCGSDLRWYRRFLASYSDVNLAINPISRQILLVLAHCWRGAEFKLIDFNGESISTDTLLQTHSISSALVCEDNGYGYFVAANTVCSVVLDSSRMIVARVSTRPNAPVLTLSESFLAFSHTMVGDSAEQNVQLCNSGSQSFRITRVSAPAGFETILLADSVLEPGESIDLSVVFRPLSERSYDGDLSIQYGPAGDSLRIRLLAMGEQPASGISEPTISLPGEIALDQNYPNPFNSATRIAFSLPHQSGVRIAVYNLLGQQVAVLQDGIMEAGRHELQFDASALASGIYFYRIQTPSFTQSRKMLLLR